MPNQSFNSYASLVSKRVDEESKNYHNDKNDTKKIAIEFIIKCLKRNRIGDAELYALLHKGKFVFVHLWGRWIKFNGIHWEEDINNSSAKAAINSVCDEYERIFNECDHLDDKEKEKLFKAVNKRLDILRDKNGRENLLESAATHIDEPLAIKGDELDKQEYLFACANGVIDLRTGQCKKGQPEQYLLKACPTAWQSIDSASTAFDEFLHSSFDGDKEIIAYILRLLGYGLLGNRDEHIWAIFHGPRGRNGKDTLMKILFSVLGYDLAVKVPTAMLMQQTFQRSGSQPEPDIMSLRGAKLAFANEGEANQSIAMGKLKDLTGGSLITTRGLNDKHMTTWQQTHLLFFLTNELPTMKSYDDAFWTRSHFIHWPIRFVDNPEASDERKRDPRIFQKMSSEKSGILARLVQGCMDYLENGLRPPEKVLSYTQEQRDSTDEVGFFLKECCLIEKTPQNGKNFETKISVSQLLAIYNWWSQNFLGNIYKSKGFTKILASKGIKTFKSNIMYYLGISVKNEILAAYEDSIQNDKGLDYEK